MSMIYGNYTALVTPMTRSGKIDFEALDRILDEQIKFGSGVVVLGSTAETNLLNQSEKNAILEYVTCKIGGRIDVFVGINAFSAKAAIEQIDEYIGNYSQCIKGFLVGVPPYIKPTDAGMEDFFLSVATHSKLPIILYNVPSRTGKNISVRVVEKLSKHKNIIGIKEASGDMAYATKIAQFSNDDFCLICGNDNLIMPFLSIGARAIISVAGNALPGLYNSIIKLYDKSATDAYKLYKEFYDFIELTGVETNPIMIKYLLSKLGLCEPYLKEPLCLPEVKNRKLVSQNIEKMLKNNKFDAFL